MLEEVGIVASVKHGMQRAVDVRLVDSLEHTVKSVDFGRLLCQVRGCGEGLGRGGGSSIEIDGCQSPMGTPVFENGLPSGNCRGIPQGLGVSDHLGSSCIADSPGWDGHGRGSHSLGHDSN